MNPYLNYLIEANICLIIFVGIFWLLLRNETNFRFKRIYIIGSVFFSLLFPLIKIDGGGETIPSLGNVLSVYMLPELVIGETTQVEQVVNSGISIWQVLTWVYLAGVFFFTVRFVGQLIRLWMLFRNARSITKCDGYSIVESSVLTPFSFFYYIFINRADTLSPEDKQQIIKHEMVHVTKHHSIDILLIEIVRIAFWMNPITHILKIVISNIHEFQADEKAVVNQDIQTYCSLLARMTLNSAGLSLANHFNKSLTLKRITMLKTVKKKMHTWKVVSIVPVMLGVFVAIACQDQVMDDLNTVVQNSSAALDVPPNVQARYDELTKEYPESKYIVMELNKDGQEKLAEMEKKHGMPKTMEVFHDKGPSDEISVKGYAKDLEVHHYANDNNGRMFVILEYNDQVDALANQTAQSGEIFTIVEQTAQPKEGMNAFYELIGSKLIKYLTATKDSRIDGKVFVEFIVETDGTLSNFRVLKGIGKEYDDATMEVLASLPQWNPARQRGKAVRQRMVLPIEFRTGNVAVIEQITSAMKE